MSANWIQQATSKNPGVFKAKAQGAGMSTSAYADKVLRPGSNADTTTKRQASLAKTLAMMRNRR